MYTYKREASRRRTDSVDTKGTWLHIIVYAQEIDRQQKRLELITLKRNLRFFIKIVRKFNTYFLLQFYQPEELHLFLFAQ